MMRSERHRQTPRQSHHCFSGAGVSTTLKLSRRSEPSRSKRAVAVGSWNSTTIECVGCCARLVFPQRAGPSSAHERRQRTYTGHKTVCGRSRDKELVVHFFNRFPADSCPGWSSLAFSSRGEDHLQRSCRASVSKNVRDLPRSTS